MRLAVVFIVVALFGAISANKALFKELDEINKHPFGATMLAAISTNLRAKTPITDVQDLLNDLLVDLQAQTAAIQNQWDNENARLTASIEGNHRQIDTFTQTISQLEDNIAAYESEGVQKVADYQETNELLEATQAHLEQTQEEYEEKVQWYADEAQGINDAISAANKALDRMNTFKSAIGASLIQVASAAKAHIKEFSKTMKSMSKMISKHGSIYAPLIHELIELTQDVEADQANEVIDRLNQLISILQQALSDLETERASYVATTEAVIATDEANIANAQANLEADSSRIEELGNLSVSAHGNLDTAEANLADAQAALELNEQALQTAEDFYNDQFPRHEKAVDILERLIEHFNNNVAALDQWTVDQANGQQ